MKRKKHKKKSPVGLILLVVVLVLAALFLAYQVLSREGLIPELPFLSTSSDQSDDLPSLDVEPVSEETEDPEEEEPEESSEEPAEPAIEEPEESSDEEMIEEEPSEETFEETESSDESSEETEEAEDFDLPYYYYGDIVPDILSALEMGSPAAVAEYVGYDGIRLSPTGRLDEKDVVLSRQEFADFMALPTMNYGISPSSGQDLYLTPQEYFTAYISPVDLDFAAANTLTNDIADLAIVSSIEGAKTVSFNYSPSVMEWRKIILVFSSEGTPSGGDVLRAIIYQDMNSF